MDEGVGGDADVTLRRLEDVATLVAGQHIESTLYTRTDSGIPYLTGPADFTRRYPHVTKWTTAPKVFARSSDVLVTVKGAGVGKVNWGCDAAIGRQLMAIRPKADLLDQAYLFHFMKSQEHSLNVSAQGATVPGIGKDDVLNVWIPIPPLSEQRRIAEILDKADALPAKRGAALTQLDVLVQSIFIDMFGDPATNPKEWDVCSLSDLGVEFRYGTSNKSAPVGRPALRIPNVVGGSIELADLKFVPVTSQEFARLYLKDGDLLFVRTNGNPEFVGRCAVYDGEAVRAAGYQHNEFIFASYLIRGRILNGVMSPIFLREYMLGQEGRRRLRAQCKTSAGQYNLNTEGLGGIRILVPPSELQHAFARRVKGVELLKRSHQKALMKANTLFASLQHRAFRGEL